MLSVNEITANAMTVLKLATEEERNYMRTWVVNCLRSIGPDSTWYKTCSIAARDNSLKKPNDYTKNINLSLWNGSNQELFYTFHSGGKRIHTDRFSVNTVSDEPFLSLDLSEDAYYFHIGGSAASQVAYGMLRYWAFPTDRDGLPLIPDEDTDAYVLYCRWWWSMRQNDNQSAIQLNRDMWLQERARIRGNKKLPTGISADAIMRSWVSMIGAPQRPNF